MGVNLPLVVEVAVWHGLLRRDLVGLVQHAVHLEPLPEVAHPVVPEAVHWS